MVTDRYFDLNQMIFVVLGCVCERVCVKGKNDVLEIGFQGEHSRTFSSSFTSVQVSCFFFSSEKIFIMLKLCCAYTFCFAFKELLWVVSWFVGSRHCKPLVSNVQVGSLFVC